MIRELLTARLLEVAHATRDPIIRRMESLITRGLRSQWKAFRDEALLRLQVLYEADENEIAIQNVLSGLRALSDSIPLEAYGALLGKALLAGANQSGTLTGHVYTRWPYQLQGWFWDHGLSKIGRDVDDYTRERLKVVIARGLEQKLSYKQIAREIRNTGLFSRKRAELIAVTEIGNAYSQGTLQGARDVAATGETVEKSWLTHDPCPICLANEEQGWIGIEDSFSSGDQAPSAHPHCRCSLLTRVVGARQTVAA